MKISLTTMCCRLGRHGFSARAIAEYAKTKGLYCTPAMVYYRWRAEKVSSRHYQRMENSEATAVVNKLKLPRAVIVADSPTWVLRKHVKKGKSAVA